MSDGGRIIAVAVLSKFILKTQLKKDEIGGCIFACVGITGVQLISVLYGSNASGSSPFLQIIGFIILIIGMFFNGYAFILFKQIFTKYDIHPLKLVYVEGFYGTIVMGGIVCQLTAWIPCPWSSSNCVYVNGHYRMESYVVFV